MTIPDLFQKNDVVNTVKNVENLRICLKKKQEYVWRL